MNTRLIKSLKILIVDLIKSLKNRTQKQHFNAKIVR